MSTSFQLPNLSFQSSKEYKVFTPDTSGLTISERSCVMAAWISILRDKCSSFDEVIFVVCNLMSLGLPGLANELARAQTVKVVHKTIPKADYLVWLEIEDRPDDWIKPSDLVDLPRSPTETSTALSNPLNAYSGLAIVLFCIGKEITADNSASVTTNRPRIVHDKYGLSEDEFKSAPGKPDGPGLLALSQVYSAFGIVTEPRSIIIKSFLSIYRSGDHYSPEIDVVMVMFRMLDGSQMTHVAAIQDMLEAHPWLLKVPKLRPSIKEYIAEMRRFAQVPEGVRGYIRLIEGNHSPFFPAPRMAPLVAVAIALKQDIEGTLANYRGGKGQYQDIVAEVKSYEAVFRMKTGVDTLYKEIGVPDVELPAAASTFTPMSTPITPQVPKTA